MKHVACLLLALASSNFAYSATKTDLNPDSQRSYEKEIQAVVRNKYFYKSGRMEVAAAGGVMPYDSVVNHYMLGGRLNWHLTDHYGWEVLDAHLAFPSLTGFTTDLVQAKGLTVFQTSQIKFLATTNFLLSPFYAKIRFIGTNVLFFDIYVTLGGGVASTETINLSSMAEGAVPVQTTARSGIEPVVNVGLGFKIFSNDAMGILIDFRDYLVYGEVYNKKAFKSNFAVFAGLSLFLPTF